MEVDPVVNIKVDQQLHGYRHGHQLLASSIKLEKADQELVNRLSDIAGPLRPGEAFKPYLTAYPLPSGMHYVLARTWQDMDVPRAGCVRTLSLLIRKDDWESARTLAPFLGLLNSDVPAVVAERTAVQVGAELSLPVISGGREIELLEALFLEERKPIVVFDVLEAELVAVRLLTSFWPSLRGSFSMSTFALSPRKLIGRSFDLVFSPKDSRSRFASWEGRRIDARNGSDNERHPWSGRIANRIFSAPHPRLLDEDEAGFLASDESGSGALLRITFLWNDLQKKLAESPTAALGLLDIANTRSTRDVAAIRNLEPVLARAAKQAVTVMPAKDAWTFLGAMTRKLQHFRIGLSSARSIRAAAIDLASRDPIQAIDAAAEMEGKGSSDFLIGAVADGLSRRPHDEAVSLLAVTSAPLLVHLLTASPMLAQKVLSGDGRVSAALAQALPLVDSQLFNQARRKLLRLLVDEWHVPAAAQMIATLDADELKSEAVHLYDVNGFASEAMSECLAARARDIGAEVLLRDVVQPLGSGLMVENLVAALLRPCTDDLAWVLYGEILSESRRVSLLQGLLRSASLDDLRSMLSNQDILEASLAALPDSAGELLHTIASNVAMPLSAQLALAMRLLSAGQIFGKRTLIVQVLDRCLRERFDGDEIIVITKLMACLGRHLDGARIVHVGVNWSVPAPVASRNILAFDRAATDAREQVLVAVETLGGALQERRFLDINAEAVLASAELLWDARKVASDAQLRASSRLLPFLMRARYEPASPLIAAAFPSVYRSLSKGDEPVGILKLFFGERDHCKSARHDLVSAFLGSEWRPSDLALAGARAGELPRILKNLVSQYGGEHYLGVIERDLELIPLPWRSEVSSAIDSVWSGKM